MFCKYIYCTLSYYDSNITESSLDLRRIGPGHQLEIFLFLLHRLRLPVVPKQQHRPSPLILHDHDPEELPLLVRPVHRLPPPVGPPGQGVPDGLHVRVHAVLVLQPGLDHLKLELSHGGQDEGSPSIVVALAEGLDRSLLQQLVDALLEGFVGGGVGVADVGEFFGAEAGDAGKGDPRRTRVERIADGEISRIVDADDVSGIRHVQRLSILPEEQLRLCQIVAFVVFAAAVSYFQPPGVRPGHDPDERQAIPVLGIEVRLRLENESGELVVARLHGGLLRLIFAVPHQRLPHGGRRPHGHEFIQKELHPEVVHGGPEEERGLVRRHHPLHVQLRQESLQQLVVLIQLVEKLRIVHQLPHRVDVVQRHLPLDRLAPPRGTFLEEVDHVRGAVQDAPEPVAVADGPEDGVRLQSELLLDLVHDVVGGERRPVHLVHEGEQGEAAHAGDLEQLARLGLQALGGVQQHHGVVGGGERAVRVLRKILMPGGVQNVEAQPVVVEGHHRARDADPALHLHFHKVGAGGPLVRLLTHRPGLLDRPPVQQQLLRHGRLAAVGVRDDGQVATALDLFGGGADLGRGGGFGEEGGEDARDARDGRGEGEGRGGEEEARGQAGGEEGGHRKGADGRSRPESNRAEGRRAAS
mmetsp:Transcript_21740/g.49425  ORF Transcript_21740/g.49425 Transcript_21740/m.49425 type:complete len:639 (+) Transcript_21740:60-1976(+)